MKISVIMSNCPRKPTGGHKIIFEYMNYLAVNNSVDVYFGYDEGFGNFNIPVFAKRFLAKNATMYFRPKWFKFHDNVHKHCVNRFDNKKIVDADIVIATDVKTAYPVYNLDSSKGKKFYFIQDFENWLVSDDYVKGTFALDMKKIVVSKWLKRIIESETKKENVSYVTNSINTDIFKVTNTNRIKHSIVFQYRENIAKGCSYALEAIKKLKNIYSDLFVTIISNENKPNIIPEWCEYHFNVPLNEVSEINNRTEVFMCTSVEEGFGLPGLEAMACGCAVVSTEYQGVLEYAVDGVNALLSPVRDIDAMVANIVKLFEDDELRKKIAENGIKTGKGRSLEKSAKEFERILVEESGK